MTFTETLIVQSKELFPSVLWWLVLPMIPFIILEQLRPVGEAPRLHDYGMNLLISFSTAGLSLPFGIAAGMLSSQLRPLLPWEPITFSIPSLATIPYVGPGLELMTLLLVMLFMHDLWFYWSHRLEHKVPVLWAFHRIHHSDERMNTATFARDHFLQTAWRSFFRVFTLGLILVLSPAQAGKVALYFAMFLSGLSLFYHSATRVRLSWLDRVFVTPQVHRIHHSIDAGHYNKNFADALPIFDILFGTYHRPSPDEFPVTGLGPAFPAPRSVWSAQFGPVWAAARLLWEGRGEHSKRTRME